MTKLSLKRYLLLGAFCSVAFASSSWAEKSQCDKVNVVVKNATPQEAAAVCSSISKLFSIFEPMGLKAVPDLKIYFQDEVFLPMDPSYDPKLFEPASIHGYFDREKFEIYLVHFNSPGASDESTLEQSWTPELAESYLVHELAHAFVTATNGHYSRRIPHGMHEALAYYIQFESMKPRLRNEILNASGEPAYTSEAEMIQFGVESDPVIFSVKSYLAIQNWGGMKYVKKILDTPVTLKLHYSCVFRSVARKMSVKLNNEKVPEPNLLFDSNVSPNVRRSIAPALENPAIRPAVSAYLPNTNEIYLLDSPFAYPLPGQTIDGALAREVAHFIQDKYLGLGKSNPKSEAEALKIQDWYNDTFMSIPRKGQPCTYGFEPID